MRGLFVDLFHLGQRATDGALEYLFKAHHDHGDDGIWQPHHSPLVQRIIELFSQRGLDRLEHVKTEIEAWTQGKYHKVAQEPAQAPPGMLQRWSSAEIELVRIYLQALPPAQWGIDDHMLAIELVLESNMAPGAMVSEAEWLATKANLMGKVQANLDKPPSLKQADAILAALPATVAAASQAYDLAQAEQQAMQFAAARAVESVRALSEEVRHKMRATVLQHLEDKAAGGKGPSLESKLLDEFGTLNRDWRRIAVTETGEAQTQGLIASLKPGTRVKRVEQYANACNFCKKIDGRIMTVVDASAPDKDPETMVWAGKNNIGRSASPKKRVGDVLVDRELSELWVLPGGLVHPHCRGTWLVLDGPQPGDDPEFAKVLAGILGE